MSLCTNDEVLQQILGISTPTGAQTALMTLLRPMAESAVKSEVGYSIEQATYTHFLPGHTDLSGGVESIDVLNDRIVFEYSEEANELFVPERPVRSITSLYEDRSAYGGQGAGDFPVGSLLTGGTSFWVDWVESGLSWSGKLVKTGSTWSTRARTVKLTYVAGLTAGEIAGTTACRGPVGGGVTQFKYAAMLAAALKFKQPSSIQGSTAGPIVSESLADYSVTYDAKTAANLFGFKMDLPPEVKELLAPFKRRTI